MVTRTVLTAALIALVTGTALADDCDVPMANWQPREAVRAMVEARGWHVKRIKIHDGCYEIHAIDADGQRVEAKIDPSTLQMVEIEHESEREHKREHAHE